MSKALDRLSKLIAQADNAGTEPEREAFLERAQQMSAAIGVELAVARAHHASKRQEMPVADVPVKINDWTAKPIHRKAMVDLFLAIARSHDVECLIGGNQYSMFCYGMPSDIEMCEKLYGVLSLQMVREADRAIKRGDQKKGAYQIDGRVYRRHFYEGFANRVSGRLWQARQDEVKRIDDEAKEAGVDSVNTGLVLRDKGKEINDFFQGEIEHRKLGTYRGLSSDNDKLGGDWTGRASSDGSTAADRANLGLSDRDVSGSTTRELT